MKNKNNKNVTPLSPEPIQSKSPEEIMGLPQERKNVPLKEVLFELNTQLDNVKGMYNNIILQQDAELQRLMKEAKNVKD